MHDTIVVERIRGKFHSLGPVLDERSRRQWAATEARELGYGGISLVARATGLARDTIRLGLRELDHRRGHPDDPPARRLRRPGGGRKSVAESDPAMVSALEGLVEPHTRGDPQSPLRWTCKSTRRLADELTARGHPVGYRTVAKLLREAGYSLQANRKTREGTQHPDRNAQFEFINAQAGRFQRGRLPVISVDTKKKELVGDFRRHRPDAGRLSLPAGDEQVEQGGASPVLPHHEQLAGATAGQSPGDRQPDRGDDHGPGAESASGLGHEQVPHGHQSHGRANGGPAYHPRRLPRRVELHRQTASAKLTRLFLPRPLATPLRSR